MRLLLLEKCILWCPHSGVHFVVWTVTKRSCKKEKTIQSIGTQPCDEQWLWWTYRLGVRSGLLTYYVVGRQKPGVGRYVKPHNLSNRPGEGSRPRIRGVYFVLLKSDEEDHQLEQAALYLPLWTVSVTASLEFRHKNWILDLRRKGM